MALSRAAATAARKAAKARGLQGNRGEDGSMLNTSQTNDYQLSTSRENYLEDIGDPEGIRYPEIDEKDLTSVKEELAKVKEDIELYSEALEDYILDEEVIGYDTTQNEFSEGMISIAIRKLKERESKLESILDGNYLEPIIDEAPF